jgi:predicted RND superfamily exporter protein
MHKFRAYFAISNDSRLAIRQTLETTGTALVFTSVVLSLGFAVLALCYLKNTADIGILCAFGTVVAFLADITVSPALMVLATRSSLFRTDAGELPAVVASDSQKSG